MAAITPGVHPPSCHVSPRFPSPAPPPDSPHSPSLSHLICTSSESPHFLWCLFPPPPFWCPSPSPPLRHLIPPGPPLLRRCVLHHDPPCAHPAPPPRPPLLWCCVLHHHYHRLPHPLHHHLRPTNSPRVDCPPSQAGRWQERAGCGVLNPVNLS